MANDEIHLDILKLGQRFIFVADYMNFKDKFLNWIEMQRGLSMELTYKQF